MPSAVRPGDVLAGRYRLVDLLAESRGGRFWRAHDRILERHVALHVIAEDDERAEPLLEAARRSATVTDERLLRVLDADRTAGLCFVVNEWGAGDSLDIMLAADGGLDPRRAAWLVSEVAGTIAAGHEVGVAHGRLVPENVLVDHNGGVRIIGFAVDAALHGLPPGRISTDVADLGGLLYASLTARWPGVSTSAVPPAPLDAGRVLRPRQVRAGIPRPLDTLCDEVVNPYSGPGGSRLREAHDLATAQGICDYLCAFVGDPTGLAAAEAAAGHRGTETIVLPDLADPPVRDDDAPPALEPDPEREPEPAPGPDPAAARAAAELATQAGLPIFGDDNDDVSWLDAPAEPPPPPPPFDDPPERPLFAPDPTEGAPVRTPRKPAPTPTPGQRGDYWPWTDTGTGTGSGVIPIEEDIGDVPGRSWLRLAAVIALCLLLLVAVVVAYNLGRGRTPLGAVPDSDRTRTPSGSAAPPAASPTPIADITASDFDPQASPPEENPELAPLAVDGDPTTAWRTETYDQNLGPGGLKTGVGLVLDLGATHSVASIDVTFVGTPTAFAVYVTDTRPTGVADLTPAKSDTATGPEARVSLDDRPEGRYVVLWLTSLPQVDGGFRGEVADVSVSG